MAKEKKPKKIKAQPPNTDAELLALMKLFPHETVVAFGFSDPDNCYIASSETLKFIPELRIDSVLKPSNNLGPHILTEVYGQSNKLAFYNMMMKYSKYKCEHLDTDVRMVILFTDKSLKMIIDPVIDVFISTGLLKILYVTDLAHGNNLYSKILLMVNKQNSLAEDEQILTEICLELDRSYKGIYKDSAEFIENIFLICSSFINSKHLFEPNMKVSELMRELGPRPGDPPKPGYEMLKKIIAYGEDLGEARGKAEGEARGEARGKLIGQVIALFEVGKSIEFIANKLNISETQVNEILKESR